MAASRQILSLLFAVGCLLSSGNARETPGKLGHLTLQQRLSADEIMDGGGCWNSLFQLRSCKNEMILSLLNGQANLGMGCCRAIRLITHQCWPNMLGTLGFTADEVDKLCGYCDGTVYVAVPVPTLPAPAPPPPSPVRTPPPPPPAGVVATTPSPPEIDKLMQ